MAESGNGKLASIGYDPGRRMLYAWRHCIARLHRLTLSRDSGAWDWRTDSSCMDDGFPLVGILFYDRMCGRICSWLSSSRKSRREIQGLYVVSPVIHCGALLVSRTVRCKACFPECSLVRFDPLHQYLGHSVLLPCSKIGRLFTLAA